LEIELVIKNYRCFQKPARITLREGFSAFLGVNNSGKSSLLRFFYEFRELFNNLPGSLVNLLRGARQLGPLRDVQDASGVFSNANQRDIELQFLFPKADTEHRAAIPTRLVLTFSREALNWRTQLYFSDNPPAFDTETVLRLNIPEDPSTNHLEFAGDWELIYRGNTKLSFAKIMPVLQSFAKTLYVGPFRNIINIGTKEDYFDIQVGEAFVKTWRIYKTGDSKELNRKSIKISNDIAHIFGYRHLEINPSDSDRTLQLIVDGKPYRLQELGAGIAQFIVVLANAAIRQPDYILIDEPELNLHPTLQLDFLTALASYARKGTLYATHSIGLARSYSERIYSVRRLGEGDSEVRPYEATPRLAEFVGELSFSSYQDLGFNKLVLVEGPSEVKTIQQFLRLLGRDHEILLIPLGGDALINGVSELELQELKRITTNISALIDSEQSNEDAALAPNRQGFVDTCTALKINCHVLKRRAMENYFPDNAVKRAFGSAYHALQPYENFESVLPRWNKSQNWRIAREMTMTDLESTDLGEFLIHLCAFNGPSAD